MGRSEYQDYWDCTLRYLFNGEDDKPYIPFVSELHIRHVAGNKTIDLGTQNMEYGIEIKSGVGDLKSGCGLNQNNFKYGYVLIPEKCECQCIGYLFIKGMRNTGVIVSTEKNKIHLVKPAYANATKNGENLDRFFTYADKIASEFYKHNAYLPIKGVTI